MLRRSIYAYYKLLLGGAVVESAVKKRSVVIGGRKTSASLESEFWEALREIAQSRQVSLSALLATIKAEHQQNSLSSAIRVFVLNHYRKQ
jgi:predicted DNA-binding ribbon-helix-helix protein